MTWTTEGPEPKFRPGNSARYIGNYAGVSSVLNPVVFILRVSDYHVELQNRCYLASFPGDATTPVWEDELELLTVSALVASGADKHGDESWRTRGLLRRYRNTIAKNQAVTLWLKEAKGALERAFINVTAGGIWPLGTVLFFVGLVVSVITLLAAFGGENPSRQWPWFGWFFVVLGVGGLGTWIALGTRTHKRTKIIRECKRTERAQDPLWQRAELIIKATGQFKLHLERFEAWFNATDQGLQKEDVALAERYQDFLVRTHLVLETSISNFTQTASLVERQTKYLKEHLEMAGSAESTHLVELMAHLNQPVEVPDALALMDARRALEHEEAFGQLLKELDEGELARRIEALPKVGLP